MQIYDISLLIDPKIPVWPGDPPVILEQVSSMDKGDHDNVSRLACSVHTGTHVDAPHHFMNDHRTVESLGLHILTGAAEVIQVGDDIDRITAGVLDNGGVKPGTVRLLVKSRNSHLWASGILDFREDFVGISPDGAEWLVSHGIRLIGVDYLSVAPYKESIPTHRALLGEGIIVLEGVDLSQVTPGSYDLYCLPLKLNGSDGAPARAILIK